MQFGHGSPEVRAKIIYMHIYKNVKFDMRWNGIGFETIGLPPLKLLQPHWDQQCSSQRFGVQSTTSHDQKCFLASSSRHVPLSLSFRSKRDRSFEHVCSHQARLEANNAAQSKCFCTPPGSIALQAKR